jgi:hypothetical protein
MAKTAELVRGLSSTNSAHILALRSRGSQEDYDDVLYKVVEDKDSDC